MHAGTEGAPEEGLRGPGGGAEMQLSRAEAKRAWLAAGGDVQKAVKRLLRERRAKVRPPGERTAFIQRSFVKEKVL